MRYLKNVVNKIPKKDLSNKHLLSYLIEAESSLEFMSFSTLYVLDHLRDELHRRKLYDALSPLNEISEQVDGILLQRLDVNENQSLAA